MKSVFNLLKIALLSAIVMSIVSCGGKDERKKEYFEKGKAYLEERNLEKARIEFKNVVQIDPKYAEAFYYLGLVEEMDREVKKAFTNYTKAAELKDDYSEPRIKLAEIYLVIGTEEYFTKAKNILWDILEKDEDNAEVKLLWLRISYKEGNKEDSVTKMEAMYAEDPKLEGLVALLAGAYLESKELEKSLDMLSQGIKQDPSNIGLRVKKASIFFNAKRYDEAEAELIEIINQDKSLFASRLALSSFYSKIDKLEKAEAVLRQGVSEMPSDTKRSMVLIQFLLLRKGAKEAVEELINTIEARPDAYDLKLTLARIYKDSHKYSEAKELFAEIILNSLNDSDKVHAKNLTAEILIAEGSVEEAKTILAKVIADYPKNNDALTLSSKISVLENDFTTAINNLRTVLRNQPGDAEVSKLLAQAHVSLNAFELAENVLKEATQVDPKAIEPVINYATFLISMKQQAQAEKLIAEAREVDNKHFKLMELQLGFAGERNDPAQVKILLDEMQLVHPDKSSVYIKRGQYFSVIKKYDVALGEFEKAYDLSRSPPDLLQALEFISKIYLVKNQFQKAVDFLQKKIDENDNDTLFEYILAKVHLSQKDVAKAKILFKSVIADGPKWPKPIIDLARLYENEGNIEDSIQVIKNGIAANNGNLLLEITLANYQEKNNQYDDAIATYKAILDSVPTNALALNNLSVLLLDRSSDASAAKLALKYAKKLYTNDKLAFIDTLSWAYAKNAKYEQSITLLRPIVKKLPNVIVFQYHLGYALYHNDKKDEAKPYLENAANSPNTFSGKENAKSLLLTY